MNRSPTGHMKRTRNHHPHGVTALLALAASPVFGFMAWLAANGGTAMAFCGSPHGIMPVDGMVTMYLLMALFHLPPWFKLVSSRPWGRTLSNVEGGRP